MTYRKETSSDIRDKLLGRVGISIFPLNRKSSAKRAEVQSGSIGETGCSKPAAKANVHIFSVELRLQHGLCAPPQTSRKGA